MRETLSSLLTFPGNAERAGNCRVAGLRCLFYDSSVLADDPSFCGALAGGATVGLSGVGAGVDGHVGCGDADQLGVAEG